MLVAAWKSFLSSPSGTGLLTFASMIAFAGNSILCRMALSGGSIDPASFTTIRILAGAIALSILVWIAPGSPAVDAERQSAGLRGWVPAFALVAYATGFSFAYVQMTAASGALVLFCCVQIGLFTFGWMSGERVTRFQLVGMGVSIAGLIVLLLPGWSSPPAFAVVLMAAAGFAWAMYTWFGRGRADVLRATRDNFCKAVVIVAAIQLGFLSSTAWTYEGVACAVASGALTSGLGYAIWYAAVRRLSGVTAATVQLSVPVITAMIAAVLLSEPLTFRFAICSVAILGGILIVHLSKRNRASA